MNNDEHLLIKHQILTNFSISKIINPSYVNRLRQQIKKSGKDDLEVEKELDKKLILDTKKFMKTHEIPGFKKNKTQNKNILNLSEEKKKMIYYLAETTLLFCKENKFTKEQSILFTQLFLHLHRITNEDIINFKNKNKIDQFEDDSYDEDNENQ